ncbi:MAG: 4-hydroxy-tetrahydrodipicolinate synthase [Candidatus Eisenbacteria sp.]|nr:4-hydroxy-tetrahydrodipicolinate synthase [Candidatus Eisenbacteria bacterium]
MFEGLNVAMVTPFTRNGEINEDKIREQVRFHLAVGTDGLVPCGTTGETPTFSREEHRRVIEVVVDEAKGRAKVIPGTGTNSTTQTIANTLMAKEAGADAALVVTPYYNKPTQAGLIRHFTMVAEETGFPIMMYNVPGRTAVNLLPETVGRLSEIENIVAVKEASGDISQMADVIQHAGHNLTVLSGDDSMTMPLMAIGGKGVVSVVGNFLPHGMLELIRAAEAGDWNRAKDWHYRMFNISNAMFFETNPAPVRTAMNLLGWEMGEVRPPLAPMAPANVEKLKAAMKAYGPIPQYQAVT